MDFGYRQGPFFALGTESKENGQLYLTYPGDTYRYLSLMPVLPCQISLKHVFCRPKLSTVNQGCGYDKELLAALKMNYDMALSAEQVSLFRP